MKKFRVSKKHPLVGLVLVVFCFISALLGVLFALGNVFAKSQHEKKWSEYDECGVF